MKKRRAAQVQASKKRRHAAAAAVAAVKEAVNSQSSKKATQAFEKAQRALKLQTAPVVIPPARDALGRLKELPEHLRKHCIKPGEVRNPAGGPRKDVAADLARAVFEVDPKKFKKMINGFQRELEKGNGKTFTALADRGYGKMTQPVSGPDGEALEAPVLNVNFIQQGTPNGPTK